MRYLTLGEVVALHRAIVDSTGGVDGIRDLSALESALGFGLAMNHPFVDGNKRIAHAAMAVFLDLNGFIIQAGVDEQERLMLDLAAGTLSRSALTTWLEAHVAARR